MKTVNKIYKFSKKNKTLVYIPKLAKLILIPKELDDDIPQSIGNYIQKKECIENSKELGFPPKYSGVRLHLTSRCNLGCVYCCADSNLRSDTLSHLQIKNAIKYLFDNSLTKKIEINFFGRGEPTMAWDLIPEAIYFALDESKKKKKKPLFSITSNGMWNSEQYAFITKHFNHVELSMDGPPCIHNLHRPTYSEKGSFSTVFNVAKRIHGEHKKITLWLSTVISSHTVENTPGIVKYLCNEFPGVRINLDPLEEISERTDSSNISAPSIKEFLTNYLKSVQVSDQLGLGNKITTSIIGLNLTNTTDFCKCSGGGSFVVSPSGKIGSCERIYPHHNRGVDTFIYGEVTDDKTSFSKESYNRLALFDASNIKECMDCFAIYFCRGGCPFSKIQLAEKFWEVTSPYCKEIKESVKKYLWYAASNLDQT